MLSCLIVGLLLSMILIYVNHPSMRWALIGNLWVISLYLYGGFILNYEGMLIGGVGYVISIIYLMEQYMGFYFFRIEAEYLLAILGLFMSMGWYWLRWKVVRSPPRSSNRSSK